MRHAYLLLQSLAYESKLGILRRLLGMLMASELGAYRAGAILCDVLEVAEKWSNLLATSCIHTTRQQEAQAMHNTESIDFHYEKQR